MNTLINETELTNPSLFVISVEQFLEAGLRNVDESFVQQVFQDDLQLTKQELWTRLEQCYDFYISYDWGRDFGIDNQRRVKELTDFLSHKQGYTFTQARQGMDMKKCRVGAVFLTDRYLRRYREQAYIKTEFSQMQETFLPARQVFFHMEARVARSSSSFFSSEYPSIESVMTISVTDHDNVFEVVAYRVLGDLKGLPSLRLIKNKLNVESKKAIFHALETGHVAVLKEALEKGYCSPDQDRDLEGRTLLHIAVQSHQLDCVRILLAFGADVNLPDEECASTPLHYACQLEQSDIFHALLDQPTINASCGDAHKNSPAHYAAQQNKVDMLLALARHKVDITIPNRFGETPMDLLSSEAAREDVQRMLDAQKVFVQAAQQNDLDKLKQLVCMHIDWHPSYLDISNEDGRSALYFACMHKNVEMVQYLLTMGANVNNRDNWDDTVLSNVCFYSSADTELPLVKLLIDAGADVHNINTWGNTPFVNACQTNATAMALYLLEHCHSQVNLTGRYFRNDQMLSAIDIVSLEKNVTLAKALLQAGAAIERSDTFKEIIAMDIALELDCSAFVANKNRLWFQLLQFEDMAAPEIVARVGEAISAVVQKYPQLLSAKDHHGRVASVVATERNKNILNALFLWHGRYRPIHNKPEHCSLTTYVFKAIDENAVDENGNHRSVAVKLMRCQRHFQNELFARQNYQLEDDCIVQVFASYPSPADLHAWPADIGEEQFTGQESSNLTKAQVEKMYCVVMPLADRNMFVSLKQERFAGSNFDVVRDIFRQLVRCTDHLHQRGVLHADIKPLNIMRVESSWKLIDLDAACLIGKDHVCAKSSTGYCPPEAIFVDEMRTMAMARSPEAMARYPGQCQGLVAHASFDVWSLGCVLFQMCSRDALPLLVVGQNDNVTADATFEDNLFQLEEWSEAFKRKKLQQIEEPMAKNLLSLMLLKDPAKRPSLSRILCHPFLTGQRVARLPGTSPAFDLFLSYRVASDLPVVRELYHRLTAMGHKVWWDKASLPVGLDWKQGFCSGLLQSRSCLCVLSRDAINHTTNARQNWNRLTAESDVDNLLLELRLGLEFHRLGFLDRLVPLFRGGFDEATQMFADYDWQQDWPRSSAPVVVRRVEASVQEEMDRQGLGASVLAAQPDLISVQGLLQELTKRQGIFLAGPTEIAYATVVDAVGSMLAAVSEQQEVDRGHADATSMAHVSVVRRLSAS